MNPKGGEDDASHTTPKKGKVPSVPNSGVVEASPTVTQFAQNPYMELKPKPSDAPNTIFSMLTKQNQESHSNIKGMPRQKNVPLT